MRNIFIDHDAQYEVEEFLGETDWDYNDEISEAYSFIDTERDNEEER